MTKRFCFLIFCIRHLTLLLWWVFLFQFVSQQEIFQLIYVTDVPCWRSQLILPDTATVFLCGNFFFKQQCPLFLQFSRIMVELCSTLNSLWSVALFCLQPIVQFLSSCKTPFYFLTAQTGAGFLLCCPMSFQSVTQLLSWRFRQARFCSWLEEVFTSVGWQSFYWTLACWLDAFLFYSYVKMLCQYNCGTSRFFLEEWHILLRF